MDSKKNGIIKLIVALVLLAFFIYTAGWGIGSSQSGSLKTVKQGLDLAGGVSITYEATKDGENPTAQEMSDTIARLAEKAEIYSTEAEVYQEGNRRINIDIPGQDDANKILEDLGHPGQLHFVDGTGKEWLTGDDVIDAVGATTENEVTHAREYVVKLTLSPEGTKKFSEATKENIGQIIYIYYDEAVISYPRVQDQITSSTCVITGMASMEEANTLAENIRKGALPLNLVEVRSNVVGASLGSNAIKTSLLAAAIGFIIVILFMIIYYRVPGLAASMALVIYAGMMIMFISAFDITMTLSGIAGIILSVGMAVDANVIIFARIREEIGKGKTVGSAIKLGFSKALSAIIDGNITTLIAAACLYFLCSGTIRGFAITLALGIILSMISSLFVCRLILEGLYGIGLRNEKLYGKTVEKEPIDFVGKRKIFLAIGGVLIVAAIVTGVVHTINDETFNYSIEFAGGASTSITMNEYMDVDEIETKVVPVVSEAIGISATNIRATNVEGSNEIIIKTPSLELEAREAMYQALEDEFGVSEDSIQTENITGSIGAEMRRNAIIAVVVACVCILVYIWFRFKDLRFGCSSVACLIHDVFIVVGCYALFRWTVGNTFIACVLTIVGYSINATIVVFDRVRENLAERKNGESLEYVVNRSVSQSISRSINTSFTTLVMVVVLYVVGVTSIKEFALPLMIGLLAGTFSSVCLAGNIWYVLRSNAEQNAKKVITE